MKCGVCGSKNLREVFPLNPSQLIYDCQACGIRQLLPQKVRVGDYTDSYYDYYGKNLQSEAALERIKLKTYALLLKELAHYVQPGRLLDIGCGFGHALQAAKALGWHVVGTEVSSDAAQLARKYTGARVHLGDASALDFKDTSFDATTFFDVIEHMPDPKQLLTRVSKYLQKGGVMLIVTPDVGSFSATVMGRRWNHCHPDHLFYFSRTSIRRIIPEGMVIRSIEPTVKVFNLAYICGYFMQYRTVGFTALARFLYAVLPRSVREFPFAMQSGSMMIIAQKN